MYTKSTSILLPNQPPYLNLTLQARLFDADGVQVGTSIFAQFTEFGLGNYTFVYDNYPDDFIGSVAFYDDYGVFLASAEVNPPTAPVLFNNVNEDGQRSKDIVIYRGNTTYLSWANSTFNNPTEIVFIIKFDMEDPVEDAMLVASLTNGAEIVLGEPYNLADDAIITFDDNFIYCVLASELTALFSSVSGTQQYDVTITDGTGIRTVAYGNCNVILSGAQ